MTKHAFPAYAFCQQKQYLPRHLIKPRSMKLRSFISSLQELNAYLGEFSPDTEGLETAPLPTDEIMEIIYHSISATQKNEMIEQKSRAMGRKENSSMAVKKKKGRKITKKREQDDSESSVKESS